MSKIQLITTEDGSHSLFVPSIKETYHSFHGALQESRHVFIKHGLNYMSELKSGQEAITIFELGLGTGLNALLVAEWAAKNKRKVEMTSVEAYPLEMEMVLEMNYPQFLNHIDAKSWFQKIHSTEWDTTHHINENFDLRKIRGKFEALDLPADQYRLIFYDAFAPNKQGELWEREILQKVYNSMGNDSVFVTYCAKGQLKRDLASIGFEVETLPGPPGKKEMVRAMKNRR